ncbi:uncharacterized [Tachysurus ichikawai]
MSDIINPEEDLVQSCRVISDIRLSGTRRGAAGRSDRAAALRRETPSVQVSVSSSTSVYPSDVVKNSAVILLNTSVGHFRKSLNSSQRHRHIERNFKVHTKVQPFLMQPLHLINTLVKK